MRRLVFIPLMFVIGCAETPRQVAAVADRNAVDEIKLARLLKGYTPGPAENCLPQLTSRYHTQGVGDTLLYSADRRVIYRNDTTGCAGVERGDVLVTLNYESRLCRGQIATTFDVNSHITTGSCSFGDFIPYRKTQ